MIEQPWTIELCEWDDACSWHGANYKLKRDQQELAGPGLSHCKTVGFLIFEDDKEIKLAQSHNSAEQPEHESVGEIYCIPKAWITSRRTLAIVSTTHDFKAAITGEQYMEQQETRPPHPSTMAGARAAQQEAE